MLAYHACGPEFKSRCRQGGTCGGQCRDIWGFSLGSPVSPIIPPTLSTFGLFPIIYHSYFSFHLRFKYGWLPSSVETLYLLAEGSYVSHPHPYNLEALVLHCETLDLGEELVCQVSCHLRPRRRDN